ncbi:hypothetical protein, partial [Nitrosomonas sp.]|uniref:hypothetical protein n=1 Tax=Nitrosomonas sp. TaxID=42353 RepID=UPI0025CC42C1
EPKLICIFLSLPLLNPLILKAYQNNQGSYAGVFVISPSLRRYLYFGNSGDNLKIKNDQSHIHHPSAGYKCSNHFY